ncbi:MAG: hypothetical protein EYC69_10030 [Bacteroidetes bacterium]|nr:MAG: hypothetical protein EYC69_10030 [Bacteroidota bacterium]
MIGTTPVPNKLFDLFLNELQGAELKVLLVIIRQTLGWQDRRSVHGRKTKDWISTSQLILKSGCSRRAISAAIDALTKKKLIQVFDKSENVLVSGDSRKGKQQLYFSLTSTLLNPGDNLGTTQEFHTYKSLTHVKSAQGLSKNVIRLAQKLRITK